MPEDVIHLTGVERDLGRVVSEIADLVSLPKVLQQIGAALKNPNVPIEFISGRIESDPNIAARVIRLANSAFYGWGGQVDTVEKAVSIVGLNQIFELLTAAQSLESFKGIPPEILDVRDFWRHSVGCGVAARILAKLNGKANGGRCFVTGLLHDLGWLAICLKFPGEAALIFSGKPEGAGIYSSRLEREILGFDHALLGAELLKHWNFPAEITRAVEVHHAPPVQKSAPVEAAIVHLADHLVQTLGLGKSGELDPSSLKPFVWERADVSPKTADLICEETLATCEQAYESLLKVNE